jgi:hypothetical protein
MTPGFITENLLHIFVRVPAMYDDRLRETPGHVELLEESFLLFLLQGNIRCPVVVQPNLTDGYNL